MTVTIVNKPSAAPSEDAGNDVKRTMSGIASPYFDLDASIKVADVVHTKGGGTCTHDQLAAWLDYKSVKSGTYLTRIAAAKSFGLLQASGGRISITDRGLSIIAPVMPEDAAFAKVQAFLAVPLFQKVYEQFRGKQIPPEIGLKNLFKGAPYLILPDRVDPAVRVFLNSAEQAGFFASTGDRSRLIAPANNGNQGAQQAVPVEGEAATPSTQDKPKSGSGGGGGGGDGTAGIHTAIVGLLRDLPPPGTVWSPKAKARFMAAFKANIDHIYPEEDEP